ncbi:MAG: RluA family pseudouridine synthase [Sphingobium sp.]|nr:RluA family pseudouridine synthase [Sphingobium sp.]MCP5397900.1 RluA family pseudouridine synthase [Sphingomonas sp.]
MSKPPSSRSRKPGSPFEKKRGGVKHGKGSKVKAAPAKRPAAPKRETASSTKTPVAPKPAKAMKPASTVALSIPVSADDDGIRLDRWFKRHMPEIGFATVSRWARTGQLRVDGARVGAGDRIAEGQVIRVPPAPPSDDAPARKRPVRPQLSDEEFDFAQGLVIHRDEQAIVINKPPGLATQGGTKTDSHVDGMLDALMFERDDRPKLVHRLDKDTSGALLLARSARAAAWFAKSFSSRTARKVYWALVVGVPSIEDGVIDLPLAKQPGTGGEKMHVDEEEGLPSRTRYRVIERAGNRACWLELQPFTGRTHQIRVHLAAIGFPIVGDGKYGGKDAFLTGSISRKMHLHSRRIRIDHPDGGRVDVRADLPPHFAESLESLGFNLAAGDLPLDEEIDTAPTKDDAKRAAKQHAKDLRKERRGERRSRGKGAAPKPRGKGRK